MPRKEVAAPPSFAGPDGARRPRRVPGWLLGLLCGAALALAPGPAILLAALLAPGLLALLLERTGGKPVARTMLLFGGCGCVAPVREAWMSAAHGTAGAVSVGHLLPSPAILAAAWLAALGGWLVCQLAPVVTGAVAQAAERRRIDRLKAARARHEEEWEAAPAD